MFSTEQRRTAIETFIRFDHGYADTVAELGYPTRATLRNWWKEHEVTGKTPVGKDHHRKSMYSDEQAQAAVEHYLEHGKSLARTMHALGYPKGRETLCGWIDELAPGERKKRGPNPKKDPVCFVKRFFSFGTAVGILDRNSLGLLSVIPIIAQPLVDALDAIDWQSQLFVGHRSEADVRADCRPRVPLFSFGFLVREGRDGGGRRIRLPGLPEAHLDLGILVVVLEVIDDLPRVHAIVSELLV